MIKEILIDGKKVKFKASAAIPRIYRNQYGRDIFLDMKKIAESVDESEKNKEETGSGASTIPLNDLSMFEQIAFVMAKHADPNIPNNIMEWLDEFDTFSIYMVLPEIIALWNLNEQTQSEAKKNRNRVAGY